MSCLHLQVEVGVLRTRAALAEVRHVMIDSVEAERRIDHHLHLKVETIHEINKLFGASSDASEEFVDDSK